MNMSPALGVEILNRILKIIKDYCGMLTEEAVRKNFALIYELLDEAIVGDCVPVLTCRILAILKIPPAKCWSTTSTTRLLSLLILRYSFSSFFNNLRFLYL